MKCSIIIVTYNAKDYTETLFKKLLPNGMEEDMELILLDNCSTDGIREVVKSMEGQKNIKVILSNENLGFAKGNNEAAKSASGEYLFLLNPDTEITFSEIRKMTDYLDENQNVGVVGPKIYDFSGLVQESYGATTTVLSEVIGKIFGSVYIMNLPIIRSLRMNYYDKKEISDVGWIGGAALMIRSELFKKINGIDAFFFYSAGDMVDLCATVKKEGYDVKFYPEAKMIHKGGASNVKDKVDALRKSFEGSLYYFKKHNNRFEYWGIKILYIIISIIKGFISGFISIFKGKKFIDISKSHFINAFWMLVGKI